MKKNLTHFANLICGIKETDLILLPEMFNTAFCPDSTHLAEEMHGPTVNWMRKIAKKKKCAITGTLMIKENGNIYNRLVWISEKGGVSTYDKRHLFSPSKESKFISKGNERLIVKLNGWKICPLICYDLRFPVFSRNNVGYDILIYLANWPKQRIDAWDTLLKARAIENQCYTIGVNRIGEDGNSITFNGHSKVFDIYGRELLNIKENIEEVVQIGIAIDDLKIKKNHLNFLKDQDNFTIQ